MKTSYRISFLCCSLFFIYSCTGNKGGPSTSSRFEAETLRGRTVIFTHVECGFVTIPADRIDKMSAIDDGGNPVYYTQEIAGTFTKGTRFRIKNNAGICVRFRVPRIARDDYLILKAITKFPGEVAINGTKTASLDSNYRYDAKYSGRTEYIWFLFDRSYPNLKKKGSWTLELLSNETVVYSSEFVLD
jgi:hypothetical protein